MNDCTQLLDEILSSLAHYRIWSFGSDTGETRSIDRLGMFSDRVYRLFSLLVHFPLSPLFPLLILLPFSNLTSRPRLSRLITPPPRLAIPATHWQLRY